MLNSCVCALKLSLIQPNSNHKAQHYTSHNLFQYNQTHHTTYFNTIKFITQPIPIQSNANNQKQQENPTAKPAQISNSKTSISSTRTQKQQPNPTQSQKKELTLQFLKFYSAWEPFSLALKSLHTAIFSFAFCICDSKYFSARKSLL